MFDKKMSRREFIIGAVSTGMTIAAAEAMWPKMLYAQPRTGGHMKIGINSGSTTNSLDPSFWGETFMVTLGFAIHGGLVGIGADGKLAADAAESWEVLEGGTKWIFKLKPGITFSNGKSMTSEDVVASLNLHRGDSSQSAGKAVFESVTDIKTDGPQHIVITLAYPVVDLPYLLTDQHIHILPSKDGVADWQSGIGAGPYILESFQPGVNASLRRNPNSYRNGYVESAELINITDVVARQAALLSGSVDVINRVDLKTSAMLNGRNGIVVEDVPSKLHYTMPFNLQNAPFENPDVRQAIKYAIDREEILRVIFNGHGSIGNDQPITPAYPLYNDQLPPKPYDPDKARFHLKRAGLDSLQFNFVVSEIAFSGAVDMAVLYEQQAAKAGIDINVNRVANDGYDAAVRSLKPDVWMNWWAGRASESTMLSVAFSSTSPANRSYWVSPEFDNLLAVARAELDENKRREYYFELQRIVSEDSASVIPVFANQVSAYNSGKVHHGAEVSGEWDLDGGRIVERWWM